MITLNIDELKKDLNDGKITEYQSYKFGKKNLYLIKTAFNDRFEYNFYSYDTCIFTINVNKYSYISYILNNKKYSNTSTTHMRLICTALDRKDLYYKWLRG